MQQGNDVFVAKSNLIRSDRRTDATHAITDELETPLARLLLTKL